MELEEQPFVSVIDDPIKHENLFSLKEYLTCPCCNKDNVSSPITLPCLHSFCMDCLRTNHDLQRQREEERRARKREEERAKQFGQQQASLEETDDDIVHDFSIKGLEADYHSVPCLDEMDLEEGNRDPLFFCCPLKNCDGVTNIPLGNVSRLNNLEVNVALSNIHHTQSVKRDLPQGLVPCVICSKTAIGVCFNKDCNNQPYCGDCLVFHLRDNKKHTIAYPTPPHSPYVDENSNDAGSDIAWNDLRQGDILCSLEDHERFFRNLYCEEHDEVVCLACTCGGGRHRRCEQVKIKSTGEMYSECKANTDEKFERVKKLHDYLRAAVKTTEEVKRALEIKADVIKEAIANKYTILEEQLRTHRDDLLKKCDDIYKHKTEELNQHLHILNRVSGTVEHSMNFADRFKESAIASEFMMLKTQLDQRLDELVSRYSGYRCETTEDDCIFMEENKSFDATTAIGCVYSTASVKNFKISAITHLPVALQPAYFSVVTHDVIGNEIFCHTTMPRLCATIRHVDEDDVIEGYVEKDKGKYFVMVYPSRSGDHELCIYQPMEAPYNRCYVGGKKIIFNVDP